MVIEEKDVQDWILDYNNDLKIRKLKERYNHPSFFEMMAKDRSETVHSAFIKWMLQGDDFGVNDENAPIMTFLDLLIRRANLENIKIDRSFINAVLSRKLIIKKCYAYTEKAVKELAKEKLKTLDDEQVRENIKKIAEKSQDRIDVFIDCSIEGTAALNRLQIIIENKVCSTEGTSKNNKNSIGYTDYDESDQTTRYYLGAHRVEDNLLQLFVYLTPLSNVLLDSFSSLDEAYKCDSKETYIQINYQDILDYVLMPLINSDSILPRIKVLLEEYRNTLTIPCIADGNEIDSDGIRQLQRALVMASSLSERSELCYFLNKYAPLIKQSLYIGNRTICEGDSEKPKCQKFMESLVKDNPDYCNNGKFARFGDTVRCLEHSAQRSEFSKCTFWSNYNDEVTNEKLRKSIEKTMKDTDPYRWTQEELDSTFGEGVVIPVSPQARKRCITLKLKGDNKNFKFQTAEVTTNGEIKVHPIRQFEKVCEELKLADVLLLLDFYKQNYRLIIAAIKIVTDTTSKKEDLINSVDLAQWRDIYEQLSSNTDRTKYIVKIEGKESKSLNKREVIKHIIENISLTDRLIHELTNATGMFRYENPNDRTRYYGLIEVPEGKDKYKCINLDDDTQYKLYVTNQWGILPLKSKNKDEQKSKKGGNFGKLLDFFETHIEYEVSITESKSTESD